MSPSQPAPFGVTAPLESAYGLPPSTYVDQDAFESECRHVFSRSWLPVARMDQLQHPGDFVTYEIAGESLVVVRDRNDNIKAFPNVCRHRSTTIMKGAGHAATLQCPNHGWSWSLDGHLLAAPEMDQTLGFDREETCLFSLRVEVWLGWVLVNLDSAASSFASGVSGLTARCEPYGLGDLVMGPSVHYESQFNWEIQIENFSESYHHRSIHPQTLQPTFPGAKSWAEDNEGEPWQFRRWLVDQLATNQPTNGEAAPR